MNNAVVLLAILTAAAGVLSTTMAAENLLAWRKSALVTLSGYTGATTLTNFPALVVLGEHITGFSYGDCKGDGSDLRFALPDNFQQLNYEIANWDTGGLSRAWVQIPALTASTTRVDVYWGNSGAAHAACTTNGAVWSEGYVCVNHLAETSGTTAYDATTNRYNGAIKGSGSTWGGVGSGLALAGAAWYELPDMRSRFAGDAATFSVWVKLNKATPSQDVRTGFATLGSGQSHYTWINSMAYMGVWRQTRVDGIVLGADVNREAWHLITITSETGGSGKWRFYQNGREMHNVAAQALTSLPATPYIGRAAGNYYMDGNLKEARISNVARSGDWITASWLTVASNSYFNSFGSVRERGIVVLAASGHFIYPQAPASEQLGTDFGHAATNLALVERSFIITNSGETAFNLTGAPLVALDGDTDVFTIAQQPGRTAFAPGDSDVFKVAFAPQGMGAFGATVSITNDSQGVYWFGVAGKGDSGAWIGVWGTNSNQISSGAPASSVNGTDFGALPLHVPADVTHLFTVTNSGVRDLELRNVVIAGDSAFSLVAPFADAVVPPDGRTEFGVRFTTSTAGVYTARVAITNNMLDSPFLLNLGGRAQNAQCVATNGNDANSGATWATAKKTIQAAITAASAGDVVLVSNGTYNVTAQTVLNKDVTVRGFGAKPADVVVNGGGTGIGNQTPNYNFSLFSVNSPGARVENITISGGAFWWNGLGAGLSLVAGTVENCHFTRNYCGSGGALTMTGGLVTNCLFTKNGAYVSGGAVYVNGGTFVGNVVVSNRSDRNNDLSYGGGIYINNGVVKNCVIRDNVSNSHGGGVYVKNGKLLNSLIIRNKVTGENYQQTIFAGGLFVEGGVVEHVTVADNSVIRGLGSGVYQSGGTIANSISYHNGGAGPESREQNLVGTAVSATYSCATPLPPGEGNTAFDPLFIDRANGDYRLHPGSAAIDSGKYTDTTDDLAGKQRPRDGGSGFARPDMGCYEMAHPDTAEVMSCDFYAGRRDFFQGGDAAFTATVAGGGGGDLWYSWDFGNSVTLAGLGRSVVTNSYTTPGWFTVTLTVSNALSASALKVKTEYIKVTPEIIYVSKHGSDTPPYATWATAARSVADAVASASGLAKCTVLVSNGLYVAQNRVDINVPMVVKSVNGPAVTTIDAQKNTVDYLGWSLFKLNHNEAVVEGLHITRGKNNYGQNGAGVYIAAGTLRGCDVNDNYAGYGGGVYMTGGVVTNCLIRNNQAYMDGGGIWANGGFAVDCVFTNNQAMRSNGTAEGGAIYMSGQARVERCRMFANWSRSHGGGVRLAGGVLRNSLIFNNKTPGFGDNGYGGGVNQSGGLMENCTVADNLGFNQPGDGLYMTGGAVTNSIITPNGNVSLHKTGGSVGYSCYTPADNNTTNSIFTDPHFTDPPVRDYTLRPTSPCINSGTNRPWMAGATDLNGSNRIESAVVDMGCFEAPDPASGPLYCNFTADRTVAFANDVIVFTASISGADTNITSYVWNFGNGIVSGPGLAVVTNFFAAGFYTVSLTVTNQSLESDSEVKTDYIYAAPDVLYVAKTGTHVAPFVDWATAATNIADAVAMAYSESGRRSTVLIGEGRFIVPATVVVDKDIIVRGAAGAAGTVISGNKVRGRRMLFVNSPLAEVSDLTLADGDWYYDGLGVAIRLDAGTVRHCAFTNNYAGYGGAIYMTSGLVEECDFRDNGVYIDGGAINMTGGLVRNCRFFRSYCDRVNGTTYGGTINMSGGTVRGCEIKGGTARSGGGGIYVGGAAARVENCTIAGCNATGFSGTGYGGGIYISAGTVTNTIVYGNEALTAGQNIYAPGGMIRYSCSPDLTHDPGGTGNINLAPQFAAYGAGAGLAHSGSDLHLLDTSPCLNAGALLAWMAAAQDIDGNPRIARGLPDMGCYELPAPRATVLLLR